MNDLDVFAQEMESLIVADSKIYRNLFKSMMGKFLVWLLGIFSFFVLLGFNLNKKFAFETTNGLNSSIQSDLEWQSKLVAEQMNYRALGVSWLDFFGFFELIERCWACLKIYGVYLKQVKRNKALCSRFLISHMFRVALRSLLKIGNTAFSLWMKSKRFFLSWMYNSRLSW